MSETEEQYIDPLQEAESTIRQLMDGSENVELSEEQIELIAENSADTDILQFLIEQYLADVHSELFDNENLSSEQIEALAEHAGAFLVEVDGELVDLNVNTTSRASDLRNLIQKPNASSDFIHETVQSVLDGTYVDFEAGHIDWITRAALRHRATNEATLNLIARHSEETHSDPITLWMHINQIAQHPNASGEIRRRANELDPSNR